MDENKCIQVAERVWGWGSKMMPDVIHGDYILYGRTNPKFPGNIFGDKFNSYDLQTEVNSWSGFGRTVEAMAERGEDFSCDDGCVYFNNFSYDVGYQVNPFNKEQFIEATHLTALEAIDAEGS